MIILWHREEQTRFTGDREMNAKLITKQTASNEVDVSAEISLVVSEWISDYDAVSAELKPAKECPAAENSSTAIANLF